MEEWKEFIDDYEVSNKGDIRSRKCGRCKQYATRIDTAGYEAFSITIAKKSVNFLVHRVVAKAFIDNPENKRTVNHKDGDKLNNDVSNLEWASYSENNQHAIDTNLRVSGEKHHKAKLTEDNVIEIRALIEAGFSLSDIARTFNVNKSLILKIKQREIWKSI